VEDLAVETITVGMETVLTELFPMVRCDDHQGMVQYSSVLQLVQEEANVMIQIGNGTLVCFTLYLDLRWGHFPSVVIISIICSKLDLLPPASGARQDSKRWGGEIGLVRVEVVEKHKKRALPVVCEPPQEVPVDIMGRLAVENIVTP
jgi:hypothetical protein